MSKSEQELKEQIRNLVGDYNWRTTAGGFNENKEFNSLIDKLTTLTLNYGREQRNNGYKDCLDKLHGKEIIKEKEQV